MIAEVPYKYDSTIKLDVKTIKLSFHFNECYTFELDVQNINDSPYKDQTNLSLALISEVNINVCYNSQTKDSRFSFINFKNIYFLKENPKLMYFSKFVIFNK